MYNNRDSCRLFQPGDRTYMHIMCLIPNDWKKHMNKTSQISLKKVFYLKHKGIRKAKKHSKHL